jgi:5-formyltetrahydrofolate cyclo-ligase
MTCCSKQIVRQTLFSIRKSVSPIRRLQAKDDLSSQLHPQLWSYNFILSFCSLPQEIDTSALNQRLALEGRLLLPKVNGDTLDLFHVIEIDAQVAPSSWQCAEPIRERCPLTTMETVDCVLVPALGFDSAHRRIGYGKGYYDRFIARAKKALLPIRFIGIGFKEQHYSSALPFEPHDQNVDEIFLF